MTRVDRPIRVAMYARVSTRDKDQDPELQVATMRDYASARGWEPSEYVDKAAAGDLAHRTAWARLLDDARRRRVDRVLVWKLDRAFRSTLHALATLRDLEHAGVGFASLTQPELDTTSATGRLVFTILAAVAEMERELIADRVREGMRLAASRGARIGRPPVTTRPGFAVRWPKIRTELAAGRISRRQAARQLRIGTATLNRLLAGESAGLHAVDRRPSPLVEADQSGRVRRDAASHHGGRTLAVDRTVPARHGRLRPQNLDGGKDDGG